MLCKGITERFLLILVPYTCFQTPCVTERFFLISVPNTYIARQRLIFQTVSNNLDLDTWGMQLVRCWQRSRLQVWDCLNKLQAIVPVTSYVIENQLLSWKTFKSIFLKASNQRSALICVVFLLVWISCSERVAIETFWSRSSTSELKLWELVRESYLTPCQCHVCECINRWRR